MKKASLILFLLASVSVFGQRTGTVDANENERLKITKDEKQKLIPYLNGDDWKIIRLLNNPCEDEKIADASDKLCFGRKGLSYGSHYSFSASLYYQRFSSIKLATLSFIKDKLAVKTDGQTIQLLTDLGERPLPAAHQLPKEIKDLAEFPLSKPLVQNLKNAPYQVSFRGLLVGNNIAPVPGHGYLIRSVFMDYYQTFVPHPRETIYYFQIVEKNQDSMVLLWREMFSRNL